ncbi:MAG: hypothetical protein LIO93_12670 [Bacteroidales bacterium]|nr:hypothetical protein [Bacteroidales bacterium]
MKIQSITLTDFRKKGGLEEFSFQSVQNSEIHKIANMIFMEEEKYSNGSDGSKKRKIPTTRRIWRFPAMKDGIYLLPSRF